jgi:hypothetical protein
MQCEHCNYANYEDILYCKRCGAPLPVLVPYHPTIEDYISPPESQYRLPIQFEQTIYYTSITSSSTSNSPSTFNVVRALFFFVITIPLTSFGVFSTFSSFGSDTRTVSIASLVVISFSSGSIFLFVRTRHHRPRLHWGSFLYAFFGATIAACMAFCIEVATLTEGTSTQIGTAIACGILTCYGLTLEGIALW